MSLDNLTNEELANEYHRAVAELIEGSGDRVPSVFFYTTLAELETALQEDSRQYSTVSSR